MPQHYPASVSLQFMDATDERPTAGFELTKATFEYPAGAPLPRVGEFLEYTHWREDGTIPHVQYVVLAVNTRIAVFDKEPEKVGWHTVITVGPADAVADKRLLIIAD